MEEKDGIIYIATNLVNGKQNVGQTIRKLKTRIDEHKNHGNLLHNAIKKYGIENFKVISFSCPEEDLDWMETFLIAELNTRKPNGYNLESGGHKNKHHHETTIQKIRENHKDNSGEKNGMYGKMGPNFGKKGLSNPLFGRKRPEISEQMKGENNPWYGKGYLQMGKNNSMYGKSPYDIWVEKYGKEIADEKWKIKYKKYSNFFDRKNRNLRPIVLISPEGVKFKISNLKQFCKDYHLGCCHIYKILRGERKYHKGWTGKYLENNK